MFVSSDELFKVHNLKPNQQWRQRFENYLKTMPGYYAPVSISDFSFVGFSHLFLIPIAVSAGVFKLIMMFQDLCYLFMIMCGERLVIEGWKVRDGNL